jgi:type I restriction enzyme S subunit
VDQLVKISPGSAGRNRVLSVKRIPEVFVPLPPLDEQHRIVSRIEELTKKIAEASRLQQEIRRQMDALCRVLITNPADGVRKRQPKTVLTTGFGTKRRCGSR